MSTLEVRLLTCDETDDGEVCDAEYGGDTTNDTESRSWARLREDAKTQGWSSVDGRDYCPDHTAWARPVAGDVDASVTALRSLLAPSGQEGDVR